MENKQFAEGISIIAKYIPEGEKYSLNACHDQIWFGAIDWVTDEEDVRRLEKLGWYEDEESWSCNT